MTSGSAPDAAAKSTGRAGLVLAALFGLMGLALFLLGLLLAVDSLGSFLEGDGEGGLGAGAGALVFGGGGLGMLLLVRAGYRSTRGLARAQARHPDEPWLWRSDWAARRIRSDGRSLVLISWIVAFTTGALGYPILWLLPGELAEGNHLALLGLAFPLVALAVLVWAVRTTLQRARFGRPLFELGTLPGVVGGELRGRVEVRRRVQPERGFQVTLSCVRRISRANEDQSEHELWSDERRIERSALQAGISGAAVPVVFTVPYSCEPSTSGFSNDSIVWRVRVRADLPGVDYAATFEVPVFRTAESSVEVGDEQLAESRARAPGGIARPVLADASGSLQLDEGSRIRLIPRPDGGLDFVFPAARNPLRVLLASVFGAAFAGVAGVFLFADPGAASAVVGVLFGAVALLSFYGAFGLLLRSTRVSVRASALELRHRTLGVGRTRVLPASEIDRIEAMTAGTGPGATWFIRAQRGSGRPVNLAAGVRSQREADGIAAAMNEALGTPRVH